MIHFLSISFLFFKHRITFFLSIFPSLQPPSPPSFFSSHHHQPARSPPSLLIVQHYPLLIGFSLNRSLQHFFPLLAVIFIAVVELNQAPSSLPILSCLDLSIIFPLDLVFYVAFIAAFLSCHWWEWCHFYCFSFPSCWSSTQSVQPFTLLLVVWREFLLLLHLLVLSWLQVLFLLHPFFLDPTCFCCWIVVVVASLLCSILVDLCCYCGCHHPWVRISEPVGCSGL